MKKHVVLALVAVAVGLIGADRVVSGPGTSNASEELALAELSWAPPTLMAPVKKWETWYRIELFELDHGRWRSAGTVENPSLDFCIRYAKSWVEGKPGYRSYGKPVGFRR